MRNVHPIRPAPAVCPTRRWNSENVADILRFLAAYEPIRGSENTEQEQDSIEAGRALLLDACADALEAELRGGGTGD